MNIQQTHTVATRKSFLEIWRNIKKSAKLASLFCFDKSIKINQFH